VQEGITNAARHAGAGTISVRLGEEVAAARHADDATSAVLRLSVRDDGRGIAPGTRPGLGWSGMEERVRALGGRLALTNEPDGGTQLDVAIPVEVAEPAEGVENDGASAAFPVILSEAKDPAVTAPKNNGADDRQRRQSFDEPPRGPSLCSGRQEPRRCPGGGCRRS
jgi:hypothetical protein